MLDLSIQLLMDMSMLLKRTSKLFDEVYILITENIGKTQPLQLKKE